MPKGAAFPGALLKTFAGTGLNVPRSGAGHGSDDETYENQTYKGPTCGPPAYGLGLAAHSRSYNWYTHYPIGTPERLP